MILSKYKILMLLTGFALMFVSCDEGLEELNVDPNEPTDVPAINLITEGTYQINDLLWSRQLNAEWAMLMVQHWAQNEYTEEQRYDLDGADTGSTWGRFYAGDASSAGSLINFSVARQMIVDDPNLNEAVKANQLAIVDILMAYAFQNLTDAFGDVPYSQALNPDFPQPAYDSQKDIYTDDTNGILKKLSDAINSIDEGAGSFDSGELIYGGDMSSWKKLGTSLLLRAAMRCVDADEATASTYISQAAGGDLITSNDDNAMWQFSSEASIANPLFIDNVINTRDDFNVSAELVDALRDAGDPRLEAYAAPTPSDTIIGLPYGLNDGASFALKATTSRPSAAVREATAPAMIIDAAEVHFLLAEGVQRGIISGDAAQLYADGIAASMNYWGISDQTAIDAYVVNNPYDANNWKASIGLQKWFAFYMNGTQAWAEHRRLDEPQLSPAPDGLIQSIPVKLPYPVTEQSRNGSSLQAVTTTPDDLTAKMWWDVN
jgi:hypothetical protein